MMNDHYKKLGPILAATVVASTMIGSGIFLLPASLGAVSWFLFPPGSDT